MSDAERIALAVQWADDAADWLARQLNSGAITAATPEAQANLDTLHDGLRVFAETLGGMTVPFPPPTIRPQRTLRVVE